MGIWQSIRGAFNRGDEPGFRPTAKEPAVVAKRFVLVVLITELADSIALELAGKRDDATAMRTRTLDQLLGLGFTPDDLEDRERQFVMSLRTGRVDGNEATAAMWRLECAGVLAWALALEPAILPVEQSVDLAPLRSRLPADAAALRAFADGATVRPLPELLAARHDWSVRWFTREVAPPSEERSRVLERVRAIRWLTEPALFELTSTPVLAGG
jgi:hypothetical protein